MPAFFEGAFMALPKTSVIPVASRVAGFSYVASPGELHAIYDQITAFTADYLKGN